MGHKFRDRRWIRRPICWIKGHEGRVFMGAVFVAEEAPKPPTTFCARCGMAPPPPKSVTW